jgi:hypothetical protein
MPAITKDSLALNKDAKNDAVNVKMIKIGNIANYPNKSEIKTLPLATGEPFILKVLLNAGE